MRAIAVFFLVVSSVFFSVIPVLSEEEIAPEESTFPEDDFADAPEDAVVDDLLTLSVEQIRAVSVMFAAICAEGGGTQFSSEQAFPYLYAFVQQCERLVLERGSFPHDVSARIFDASFAVAVEASDSDSDFYSQFAVYFLQSVWRNNLALDRQALLQYEVYGAEESFDLMFAHSERIYVLSAVLSALGNDAPRETFSARLGVKTDILFPEKSETIADVSAQEKKSLKREQGLPSDAAENSIDPYVFVYFGSVLPILFCVNFFAVMIALFATRQRR